MDAEELLEQYRTKILTSVAKAARQGLKSFPVPERFAAAAKAVAADDSNFRFDGKVFSWN